MTRSPSDPSVFHEPHMQPPQQEPEAADPAGEGDIPGLREKARLPVPPPPEGSVLEEPAFSPELAVTANGGLTYAEWLETARRRTPVARTWLVTVLVALLAGPWAVLGAFLGAQLSWGLMVIVVFGPLTEEILKVSVPLYIVEKRPYLFTSAFQIALCALLGGLVFAAIENVLYLEVYVPDPAPGLVAWRWTACVALHTVCSLLASVGVIRVWRDAWRRRSRPRLSLALPAVAAAAVLHGAYNAAAAIWSAAQGAS